MPETGRAESEPTVAKMVSKRCPSDRGAIDFFSGLPPAGRRVQPPFGKLHGPHYALSLRTPGRTSPMTTCYYDSRPTASENKSLTYSMTKPKHHRCVYGRRHLLAHGKNFKSWLLDSCHMIGCLIAFFQTATNRIMYHDFIRLCRSVV